MSVPDDFSHLLDAGDLVQTAESSRSQETPPPISFLITGAQREKLRTIGYEEAVIGAMTPEDAHNRLKLVLRDT